MTPRAVVGAVPLMIASMLSACSGVTEVVVEVRSDLAVPGELDAIELVVSAPGQPPQTRLVALPGDSDLPARFTVLDEGSIAGPVTLDVRGLQEGERVVVTRELTRFVPNRTVFMRVELNARCRDVACLRDETCREGACVRVEEAPRDGGTVDAAAGDAGPTDAGGPACPSVEGCDTEICVCDADCDCDFTCGARDCEGGIRCVDATCSFDADGAERLDVECERASCTVSARGSDTVDRVRCRDSECTVDCRDSDDCQVACERGSECLVFCDDADDCEIKGCGPDVEECDDGVLACRRACPDD